MQQTEKVTLMLNTDLMWAWSIPSSDTLEAQIMIDISCTPGWIKCTGRQVRYQWIGLK